MTEAPVCPVCHSPFMIGCNWYGPAPDHHVYTLCARCDMKAGEEPYRSHVIATLNRLEAERKDLIKEYEISSYIVRWDEGDYPNLRIFGVEFKAGDCDGV